MPIPHLLLAFCISLFPLKVIAVGVGIATGPACLNIINVDHWGDVDEITLEFTRIVIAVQVMAAGVSLPK
ncbi:hypothetical protein BC936DRAFT_140732 [Jimgerdemannia flammicorona]|uniref:Uncharacterized protein n=1 Tax=Jimgerdemannia flammicorona TaxID=994334 RepID=A0A433DGU0_9FUNG|nr:hypothetical protein BC936DRAFT_140732 [Jimgerdemannia flammicorona]